MYYLFLIFLQIINNAWGVFPSSFSNDPLSMITSPDIPKIDPNGIFKKPTVSICEGDEKSFIVQTTINGLINGGVFKPVQRLDSSVAPCENNTKLIAKKIDGCLKEKPDCNLSYVAFVLSIIQDKMTVVGQGIRQRNGNVLTVYGVLQFGDSGLWVKYYNTKDPIEVICMTKLEQCSGNILANEIFIVELVVKSNSAENDGCSCCKRCVDNSCNHRCIDDDFTEPEFLNCTNFPLVPGYLVKQKNCFSTDYEIDFMPALLEFIPNVAASIVIPNKPNDFCLSFQGGVFITKECQIGGIIAAKPTKLANAGFSLPAVKELGLQCVQLAGTYCSRFIKGVY